MAGGPVFIAPPFNLMCRFSDSGYHLRDGRSSSCVVLVATDNAVVDEVVV